VAFGRENFIVSGGFDQTLKIWDFAEGEVSNSRKTCIAHLKEVVSLKVSPNNKIIATGSHDKTIKLWSTRLKLIRTLEGHKRGIWDLAFC